MIRAKFMNDKNFRLKTLSILLISLLAFVALWSPYIAPTWSLFLGVNTASACSNCETTYHNVTVNAAGEEILLQIEPMLLNLPQTECSFCGQKQTSCSSCTQDQGCSSANVSPNVNYTVLEQSENRTVVFITLEFNGTTYEATTVTDLIWSHEELVDGVNRTAKLGSLEITMGEMTFQFYRLIFTVQHAEYNLTLYTLLMSLNNEIYNGSITFLNYTPAGKSGLVSLEFVNFDSSVTLSQQCHALGKVAKEVGKLYEKNAAFAVLAERYNTIDVEAKRLAVLVEQQLQGYDKVILKSKAIMMDPSNAIVMDGYPPCTNDSYCQTYLQDPYACCQGYGCDFCDPCDTDDWCQILYNENWTCIGGFCRGPYYPPPSYSWECLECLINCGLNIPACAFVCYDALGICVLAPPLCPLAAAMCIICVIASGACFVLCGTPCGW